MTALPWRPREHETSAPLGSWGDHFAEVVFELAPDGMAVTDDYGRMLHVNGRFEDLFGFDRHELVGHTVEMLLPEGLRTAHRHHRRDYEQDPRARPMGEGADLRARHRDGTEFPVEIALSPISTSVGLRTIMAVRASTEPHPSGRSGDGAALSAELADIATRLDAEVIEPIFSASLRLHGLVDDANLQQLAELYAALGELDNAVRASRRLVFRPGSR